MPVGALSPISLAVLPPAKAVEAYTPVIVYVATDPTVSGLTVTCANAKPLVPIKYGGTVAATGLPVLDMSKSE